MCDILQTAFIYPMSTKMLSTEILKVTAATEERDKYQLKWNKLVKAFWFFLTMKEIYILYT